MRAERWWQYRSNKEVPTTIEEALEHSSTLRKPTAICVAKENGYDVVIRHIFGDKNVGH